MTALDELEKRLEGPGLIVALAKDEARALLSAAREGEKLKEDAERWRAFLEFGCATDFARETLAGFADRNRAALQSEKPRDH
jgi:hypothetical protein